MTKQEETAPPRPDPLSDAEIKALRQNLKEAAAYAQKKFPGARRTDDEPPRGHDMNQATTTLPPEEVERIKEAIEQRDAIMALSGFKKTTFMRTIDDAVLAGRVPRMQAGDEMIAWIKEHKTGDGFIETRTWVTEEQKLAYRNRPPGDDDQSRDEYPYEYGPIS